MLRKGYWTLYGAQLPASLLKPIISYHRFQLQVAVAAWDCSQCHVNFCKASFLALLVGKRAVLHITEPQHVRKTLIFLHSPVLILQKRSNISGTYIPVLITYMWQTRLKAMLGITINNEDFYLQSLGKIKRRCKYIWKNQLQLESFNSP